MTLPFNFDCTTKISSFQLLTIVPQDLVLFSHNSINNLCTFSSYPIRLMFRDLIKAILLQLFYKTIHRYFWIRSKLPYILFRQVTTMHSFILSNRCACMFISKYVNSETFVWLLVSIQLLGIALLTFDF